MQIKNLKKKILALIPKRVTLVDIDYRDKLSDWDKIMEAVQNNDKQCLYDGIDDWYYDAQYEGIKYAKSELVNDVQREFAIEQEDAKELIERYEDAVRDKYEQADDSDVMKDLINNTGDLVWFYDTGLEFSGYGNSAAQYRLDRYIIKKHFSITNSDQDKWIDEVLYNASYGGRLVVFFTASIDELLTEKEVNVIKFKNAHMAIIHTMNGSGHDQTLMKHEFYLPFKRSNLFLDRAISYSYTYDVCGMSDDWCSGTGFELAFVEGVEGVETEDSTLSDYIAQQRKFDEVFKAGGCTFGDMKFTRHKNTVYKNEYPCGNHCTKCGTFWVD